MTKPKPKPKVEQQPDASWDDSALIPAGDDASPVASPAAPPATGEDTPEFVTWWDPTLGRYVGGRHRTGEPVPDGVELLPYVNTRDMQDWSG